MSRLNVDKLIKFINEQFKICTNSIIENININDSQMVKSFSSNIDDILKEYVLKIKRFGSLHNYTYNKNIINISLLYSLIFLSEYDIINSSSNREEYAINRIMILMIDFLKDTTNETIQALTKHIKKNIWIIDLINDKIRLFYEGNKFDISKDNIFILYTGECYYEPLTIDDKSIIPGKSDFIHFLIDDEENFMIYGKNKFITIDGSIEEKIKNIFVKSTDDIIPQSEMIDDFEVKSTKKAVITMKLIELQEMAKELKIEIKESGKKKTKAQLVKEINNHIV